MFRSEQLGPALRALRSRRQLKQLQVAARAGITSSMLSGYENGRKSPTLATLEKILLAMECGLRDLLEAFEGQGGEGLATGRDPTLGAPESLRYPSFVGQEGFAGRERAGWGFDLEAILGSPPLAREEAAAFSEMLCGYYRWLRYLRRQQGPFPPRIEDA